MGRALISGAAMLALSPVAPAFADQATYSYDSLNRLTKVSYLGGAEINFAYDEAGNRVVKSSTAPANRAPSAVADTLSTTIGASATLTPLANDRDLDGDTLTISAVTSGAHGTASLGSGGVVTYAPTAGYAGTDSFTYTIGDGHGGTATGTVTVSVVNRAPVAIDEMASTSSGTAVNVSVLANDSDPDGDTLAITGVTTPGHGTVAIGGTSVTYTPATGYVGADAFAYTVADGRGGTATAVVAISVG